MSDNTKKNLKQKLLKNDDMIDDQGRQLNDMERNLKETEDIGITIQENLRDQRGRLEKANEDVKFRIFLIFYQNKGKRHSSHLKKD